MPASDSDSDALGPNLLALGTVSPNSFGCDSLLRGRIDNVNPCRDGVASFKIKDDTGALWIQLRGNWAEEAIRTFNQIGKPITVRGQGGSIKATKDKHGNHVTNDRGWKTYQIVYTEGIQGFWGTEGRGFAFKGKSPFSRSRTDTGSTDPHPRPSSTSTSKHQRALSKLNENGVARPESIDREILSAAVLISGAGVRSKTIDTTISEGDGAPTRSHEGSEDGAAESDDRDGPPKKKTRAKLEYSPLSHVENLRKKNANKLNLIAIAITKRAVYQSKKDFCSELWLYDPTHLQPTIRLCHFGLDERDVPAVQDGDILIIQNLNWQKDRDHLTAFGNNLRSGPFLVVPSKLAEEYRSGQASQLLAKLVKSPNRLANVGEEEFLYARDVALWSKKYDVVGNHVEPVREEKEVNVLAASAQVMKGGGKTRKQVTISEIQSGDFYDVQGEIVKFYNPTGYKKLNDHDSCQLFITDYTRNDQLLRYDERSDLRFPGQYVLQISVWGHQAQPLLKSTEEGLKGRFVHCRNLLGKTNEHGFLEGNMYIDEKRKDRSDITIKSLSSLQTTPWWTGFERRRDLYCNSSMEDKLNSEFLTLNSQQTVEAKNEQNPFSSMFDTGGLERQPMSSAIDLKMSGTFLCNARVIDFKPDSLEEFVIAYCTRCAEPLAPGLQACLDHEEASHMYRFALVLEGERSSPRAAPPRILVEVTGRQAEILFPGLAPRQVFSDPAQHSSSLRSRLSPILGPLVAAKGQRRLGARSDAQTSFTDEDVGPWKDFVVEAWIDANAQLRWRFDENRTRFA
ncbi:hypothetical protein JCM11491_003185 [Sporobolomyces phaffii]